MKVTATQIKQNSAILQEAVKEDIVVTKRDKPFVVIVEYDKYLELEAQAQRYREELRAQKMQNRWLESARESESKMGKEEHELYRAIEQQAQKVMERPDD